MKNALKIAFLGIIGFAALVFLTAEKPTTLNANDVPKGALTLVKLPSKYEIVGEDKEVLRNELFVAGQKTLVVVGNHDSLSVVKELPKYYNIQIPYVMVANISAAPWFVKKLFIPGKLEEINENSNIPMVYDFDGDMAKSLNIIDNSKTAFSAYVVASTGVVTKVFEGRVKEGAIDGSMNEQEKKEALKPLLEYIK